MMLKRASRMFMTMLVVLLWLASAGVAAEGAYSRIVAFGDSVLDPGNAFTLLHTSAVPPFELVPSAPYARGGHHFSNGATWVEQLGATLGLNPSPGPAFQVALVFSNYAVGGSRARAVGPIHLATQVERFLTDFGGAAPTDALYVPHIGSDDLRDALVALQTDPSFGTSLAIIGEAISAIQANIVALALAGAHTFLVPNAPDLSLVPEVRLAGPAAQAAGQFLAATFNASLEAVLSGLEGALGVKIFRLDIFALLDEVVAAPAAFGLTEVEGFCITPLTKVRPFCPQPDEYLFWDGIHPTRVGHGIITGRALAVLAAP
jgi:phospholipase/lecithinase/hemolysin